jgi:hypothetical protein
LRFFGAVVAIFFVAVVVAVVVVAALLVWVWDVGSWTKSPLTTVGDASHWPAQSWRHILLPDYQPDRSPR